MYKHIYMYIYTHVHTKTRAAAAASILCPRPQLKVFRFYNLTIGVLDNVIYTISRFYYRIVQALPKRLLLVIQSSLNYYSLKLQQNSMRAFFLFHFSIPVT